MANPTLTLAQLGAKTDALSAQTSALQFALNTQVATLQAEINALTGGPGIVAPTPNTLVLRDGSGGAKAAYIDSGAASDLLVKRNGTTQLTIGSALLTAAVAVAAPSFVASTGVAAPVLDSGAAVDLLVKRNGVTKLTLGASAATFANNVVAPSVDSGAAADLPLKRNGATIVSVTASGFVLDAALTPTFKHDDRATTGVGATWAHYAQKGNGPNAGGIYKIGGGASGDGSTVAGATQVDLGALTGASLSAKLTVSAVAGLGVSLYQADATKFLIEATAAQFTILNTGGTTGIVQVAANGHSALEVGWSNTHSAATVRVGGDGYLTFFGGGSTPVSQRTITNNSGGSLQATLAALPSGTVWASDAQTVKDWIATVLLGLQELNLFHN